jgi:hypothetical protein
MTIETTAGQDVTGRAAADDVLLKVADTLERLAARVGRDLDSDAGEVVPPEDAHWVQTLAGITDYAQSCLAVLDEPAVLARLTAAMDSRDELMPIGSTDRRLQRCDPRFADVHIGMARDDSESASD